MNEENTQDVALENNDVVGEGTQEDTPSLQEQLDKQKERNAIQQRILTKNGFEWKDGKYVKTDKPEAQKETNNVKTEDQNLTGKDVLALSQASIAEDEDIEYLLKTSKGFGMTVAEALRDPIIKAKLEERQEERTTAEATNTKGAKAGNVKASDSSLLANAQKGNMPESNADMVKLIKARRK